MKIRAYGITDRGQLRPANEDALFLDDRHHAYAVADGLGGLPGGADASRRIVELLRQTFDRTDPEKERVNLGELIIGIHRIVAREGEEAHPFTGSGSTLTIAQIVGDQCCLGHVGDSAAFLLREGHLEKLTIDHTMEQELIKRLGDEALHNMPPEYPHMLTRCVGQDEELQVDQTRVPIQPADRLLLCTDGLNKVLSEENIAARLSADASPEAIAKDFVTAANALEGPDNITLVVLQIEE